MSVGGRTSSVSDGASEGEGDQGVDAPSIGDTASTGATGDSGSQGPTGNTAPTGNSGSTMPGCAPGETVTVVDVKDNVTSSTTWVHCHVYLIEKLNFTITGTLTLETGVVVKLGPAGPGIDVHPFNGGAIHADGTAAAPVVFTSYRDDVHGGDTDDPLDTTSEAKPAAGDWEDLDNRGNEDSSFHQTLFLYGGKNNRGVLTLSASASVTNSTFGHNLGSAMSYGAITASGSTIAATTISHCAFFANTVPIAMEPRFDLDANNVFHVANEAPNTYDAVFIRQSSTIATNVTWSVTEVPFVLAGLNNHISSPGKLTLASGVTLKFMKYAGAAKLTMDNDASIDGFAGATFTSFDGTTWDGIWNFCPTATYNGQCHGSWVHAANVLLASN